MSTSNSSKLQLILSKPRGFCAGVERAIETVEFALKKWGPPIYVKHEIVHNRHVIEGLRKQGAIFVENLSDVPHGSKLIFSAHGVSPSVRQEAKERQLVIIDATCGLVTRIHSAVKRFAALGYQIILIGHRNHVEIIGTAGEAPEKTTVIESAEEVNTLPFSQKEKLFYVTQTTLSLEDVQTIVERLKERYPKIETLPTSSICYATTNRQMALRQILPEVDVVLVVGDPTSSNSNRLCEVARNGGLPSYLINDADEIQPDWFKEKNSIGLTAGASTPEIVVQRCIKYLIALGISADRISDHIWTEEDIVFQLPKEVITTPSN